MNLTVRTRKGNYYTANLKWLLLPVLILLAGIGITIWLSVYQANYDKVYQKTYDAILAQDESVTVPTSKLAENAVRSCAYSTPEIFTITMLYYHHVDNNTVYRFDYNGYANNYEANLVRFNLYIDGIMATCPALDGEEAKVKWIHDYIIEHFEYGGGHSTLGMLDTGMGVCSGYTGLFLALAERMGLECGVAVSDAMDHTWNIVKVNNKWYHVDVTWDDAGATARYDYYLKTEAEFKQLNHYNWKDTGKVLTSYDNLRRRMIIIGSIALAVSLLLTCAPLVFNVLFR